jgi:hypothetical protein
VNEFQVFCKLHETLCEGREYCLDFQDVEAICARCQFKDAEMCPGGSQTFNKRGVEIACECFVPEGEN